MSFQITALGHQRFARLFAMPDDELAANLATRMMATEKPGFPCRVSLADAEVGDEVMLVNYQHQEGASPYRAAHAIFVRKGVEQAHPARNEVPELLRTRMLSLRAFDSQAMIVGADLVDGKDLGPALDSLLADETADYVHIHYAKVGCYAARAERA
jgi:Protein of unknown function (DUF1203)